LLSSPIKRYINASFIVYFNFAQPSPLLARGWVIESERSFGLLVLDQLSEFTGGGEINTLQKAYETNNRIRSYTIGNFFHGLRADG
jgi:hypothetical protein